MIEMYKKVVFQNYFNFSGRARRKEYWLFNLASLIISVILGILDNVFELTFLNGEVGILRLISFLLVLLPSIAVTVRRLHDVGKSGLLIFLIFIPFLGALGLLIYSCIEGDEVVNEYGSDPKNNFNELDEIGKE